MIGVIPDVDVVAVEFVMLAVVGVRVVVLDVGVVVIRVGVVSNGRSTDPVAQGEECLFMRVSQSVRVIQALMLSVQK